jgi:serine/threonine-protein kinase
MSRLRSWPALALAGVCLAVAQPTLAMADDSYGAIAFSTESGASGHSYNYGSREEAEERALQECGSGCEVVLWFKNGCGALAVGNNNGWGTGWSGSREEAENNALNQCSQQTSNCDVKVRACTAR